MKKNVNLSYKLKIVGLAISVTLLCLSSYYLFSLLSSPPSYKGWYVEPNDVLKYCIVDMRNSSLDTKIDEIYEEYRLDTITEDVFGDKVFSIKILDLPHEINIEEYIRSVVQFKTQITVARIFENNTIIIKNTILPFVAPVGYWNEIIATWSEILLDNANFSYEFTDLTDEYEFNIEYIMEKRIYKLWIVWDENKGTLEAMSIQIEANETYDYLHITLCGVKLSRDTSSSIAKWALFGIMLMYIFIGSLVVTIYLVFIIIKSKTSLTIRRDLSVAQKLWIEEIFNKHSNYSLVVVLINHILGLLAFPILILLNVKTKIGTLVIVTMLIILPLLMSFLLDYHIKSDVGSHFHIVFLSFLNGILIWFMSVLIMSETRHQIIFQVFLIIMSVLSVAILFSVHKTYRGIIKDMRKKWKISETNTYAEE